MSAFAKKHSKQMTFIQQQVNQIKKINQILKLETELKFMRWRILKQHNSLIVFKIKI